MLETQKQMQSEYQEDLDTLFMNDLKRVIESKYRRELALSIKRGINLKRLKKNNENK